MIGTLVLEPDTRPEVGAGHIARCAALGAAWERRGGRVVGAEQSLTNDEQHRPTWRVVDRYGLTLDEMHKRRALPGRSAVIDDHGSLGTYDADLVIDQNLGADRTLYASADHVAAGVRFAMLRAEFREARLARSALADEAEVVLLSIGGAPGPETLAVAEAVTQQLESAGYVVDLLSGATDVGARMAGADVALAASGSSAYELACVGTPAVLFAVAPNQEPVGEHLDAAGAAVYAGRLGDVTAASLATQVERLAGDAGERSRLSEGGRALVDGRGADRVVTRLRSIDLDLVPATADDSRTIWEWANDAEVRRQSFASHTIGWDEHTAWFARRLRTAGAESFMVYEHGVAQGFTRLDVVDREATLGFNLDESARGRGLGAVVLMALVDHVARIGHADSVVGIVRSTNAASIASFELAGFDRFDAGGAGVVGYRMEVGS